MNMQINIKNISLLEWTCTDCINAPLKHQAKKDDKESPQNLHNLQTEVGTPVGRLGNAGLRMSGRGNTYLQHNTREMSANAGVEGASDSKGKRADGTSKTALYSGPDILEYNKKSMLVYDTTKTPLYSGVDTLEYSKKSMLAYDTTNTPLYSGADALTSCTTDVVENCTPENLLYSGADTITRGTAEAVEYDTKGTRTSIRADTRMYDTVNTFEYGTPEPLEYGEVDRLEYATPEPQVTRDKTPLPAVRELLSKTSGLQLSCYDVGRASFYPSMETCGWNTCHELPTTTDAVDEHVGHAHDRLEHAHDYLGHAHEHLGHAHSHLDRVHGNQGHAYAHSDIDHAHLGDAQSHKGYAHSYLGNYHLGDAHAESLDSPSRPFNSTDHTTRLADKKSPNQFTHDDKNNMAEGENYMVKGENDLGEGENDLGDGKNYMCKDENDLCEDENDLGEDENDLCEDGNREQPATQESRPHYNLVLNLLAEEMCIANRRRRENLAYQHGNNVDGDGDLCINKDGNSDTDSSGDSDVDGPS